MVYTSVLVLVTLGLLQALWGLGTASILPTVTARAHEHNSAPKVASDYCFSCVTIDSLCYNYSLLFELQASFGVEKVEKMGIMRSNNVLYYKFAPPLEDREYAKVGYVYLDTPTSYGVIERDSITFNFRTFDIDQNQNTIYLGGSDGIWYSKNDLPYPKFFAAKGSRVTNVIYRDYVYFTAKDSQGIRQYYQSGNGGKYKYTLEDKTIEDFVIMVQNRNGYSYIVIYVDDTGMYAYNERKQQEPVKLSSERFVRGLTVDAKGTAYAWLVDGIYKVTIDDVFPQSTLTKVSSLAPDSMAFDKFNNIVFTSGKKLQKLSKIDSSYCAGSNNLVKVFKNRSK